LRIEKEGGFFFFFFFFFFFIFFFSCKTRKNKRRKVTKRNEIEIWIMRIMIIRIIIRKMKGSAAPDSSSPSYLV